MKPCWRPVAHPVTGRAALAPPAASRCPAATSSVGGLCNCTNVPSTTSSPALFRGICDPGGRPIFVERTVRGCEAATSRGRIWGLLRFLSQRFRVVVVEALGRVEPARGLDPCVRARDLSWSVMLPMTGSRAKRLAPRFARPCPSLLATQLRVSSPATRPCSQPNASQSLIAVPAFAYTVAAVSNTRRGSTAPAPGLTERRSVARSASPLCTRPGVDGAKPGSLIKRTRHPGSVKPSVGRDSGAAASAASTEAPV